MNLIQNGQAAPWTSPKVGFLLVDKFGLISYASVVEPFRAANSLSGRELYNWKTISLRDSIVQASNGDRFIVDATIKEECDFDIIFVCAGGSAVKFKDGEAFSWLRLQAARGARIAGVSGGTFLLARAGLLEGKRCTIHWEHIPAFREEFPELLIEDCVYVIDGRRMTCAGGSAGLDLALQLIASDHSQAMANAVSDWYIQHQSRDSTITQRLSVQARYGIQDAVLVHAIVIMEMNISQPIICDEIANRCNISLRQLQRLFAMKIGETASRFYKKVRLQYAAALLRETPLSVTEISIASGFANAAHFSRSFRLQYGISPRIARQRISN